MIIEGSNKLGLQTKKVLEYLKANPEKITILTDHLASSDLIEEMGLMSLQLISETLS